MAEADNNVVFNEAGEVCVNACENCPFLAAVMGEHCALRPEIDMAPLYREKGYLPAECPLRPGGLQVILDFNREEMLERNKRFRSFPT